MKSKLLRGVLVTNHGSESEAVVMAVEAHAWHKDPAEASACQDPLCQRCHRIHALAINGDGGVKMVFDFENRQVYPALYPEYGKIHRTAGLGPIPPEDLAKFNADFGLYYSS